MFVGCQWVFTTFVRFWKVLWVWSGFLGKVLEGMLVRVWEETIADTIVGRCCWVCSGSRFYLCSVVWGAHQEVWSGFLGRFMGDMIGRTWEETSADHPLQGIAVRIGFWNLDLEFWISEIWFWILEFWFWGFGSWSFWIVDSLRSFLEGFMGLKWFPWEGSGGDACESLRGNHCRPSSPGNDLVFVRCFLHGSEVVWCGGFWRGCLWESGRKPLQTPLLGNALEFVLVPVSIFVRWFGGHIKGSEVVSLGGLWEIWLGEPERKPVQTIHSKELL